jgi:hypothetical protein
VGLSLIADGTQTCNEDFLWCFHPVLFEKEQLRGKSIFDSAWFGLTSIESSKSAVLREEANMRQFTTVVEFIIHYLH